MLDSDSFYVTCDKNVTDRDLTYSYRISYQDLRNSNLRLVIRTGLSPYNQALADLVIRTAENILVCITRSMR